MFRSRLGCAVLISLALAAGCNNSGGTAGGGRTAGGDKPITVAFVTNCVASFWNIAEKGAQDSAKESNVTVLVKMPPTGSSAEQQAMCEDLISQKVQGVAISPKDPDNQGTLLQQLADSTILITHDSDAPKSPRLVYVGMDNYIAGQLCGELVKEALPDGGTVMVFVGTLGQLNAKQRRQGLIDKLLDREPDSTRYDEPGKMLKGSKFTILDTRTDDFDQGRAKSNAEDALVSNPDLACMVGLFAYNPPAMLEATKAANRIGKVKLVAFDEDDATLKGIQDGTIVGTIVQDPYNYGFQSVRILAALARGDKSVIPPSKFVEIPARQITKENIAEFWTELKKNTGAK